MTEKWIDISVGLKNRMLHWPGDPEFSIRDYKNIKNGDSSNVSLIKMGAHSGTHIDSPYHFFNAGAGVDLMPVEAMIGKVKIIEIKDNKYITSKELSLHRIVKGERIILKTKNSATRWEEENFNVNFIYLSNDGAKYLAEKKIKMIGVDYLSVGGYKKDGSETHRTLLGTGVWIIEGLSLYGVAPGIYSLICLPVKIIGADGSPARAVIKKIKKNIENQV